MYPLTELQFFKMDLFLVLTPLNRISPSAHTHIHSLHCSTELKVKNTKTTMDISLIYYHLFNKENLCAIGDFLSEKIPHTIYNIFRVFLSLHQWYWLTVQYHGYEGPTPVNWSVKGSDLILRTTRQRTEHVMIFILKGTQKCCWCKQNGGREFLQVHAQC